ncbi:MAG: SMC-Scp complex subunit ScpB [Christensenellales bacterium]
MDSLTNLTNIIEALIFSAGKSIGKQDILDKLDYITEKQLDKAIDELKVKYGNDSGVVLLTFNNKYQFSSNPKYGEVVADCLLPLREKELSKTLLEVLAIIAYRQPITRLEIEEIRGVNCEYSTQMLSKLNLITVVGRKEAVGRPSLFATTDEFLKKFNIESLDELPSYDELLERIGLVYEETSGNAGLYKEVYVDEEGKFVSTSEIEKNKAADSANAAGPAGQVAAQTSQSDEELRRELENEEIPDFLVGEKIEVIE